MQHKPICYSQRASLRLYHRTHRHQQYPDKFVLQIWSGWSNSSRTSTCSRQPVMKALSSSVHKSAMECSGGQRIPSSLWFFSLETHTLGTCQFQKRRPRYNVHARALDAVERLLRWRNCLELVFLTHFAQCILPSYT
jgi:hypothetical protein